MPEQEDTPTTFELSVPRLIDGDPFEVERQILDDLAPVIDEFAEYLDGVALQLANTERQRILTEDPKIDGDTLRERYEETARAGAIARLTGSAKALCASAAELEPGDESA